MIEWVADYPALLVKEDRRTLVFSDLHIGWEASLAEKGFHIPSQTKRLLAKVGELVALTKPTTLLILGDIKQTVAKTVLQEWKDVPEFLEEVQRLVEGVLVIPGNHDGNLDSLTAEAVEILPVQGHVIGDTGFIHGHAWFSPDLLSCRRLVMGHVHPILEVGAGGGRSVAKQVWVKAPVDPERLGAALLKSMRISVKGTVGETLRDRFGQAAKVSQLFIMPSFNDFLGGYPLNRTHRHRGTSQVSQGPILKSGSVDLDNAEVYLLDGSYLGRIGQLPL